MKYLNGSELAAFIKERQYHQVRKLKFQPKLAIIQTKNDPVIDTFVRLKQAYGEDIGIATELHKIDQEQIKNLTHQLNQQGEVTGIIIQLPLDDEAETDEVLSLVDPAKDVDSLGKSSKFPAPTPTAIMWLLAGYNIDLKDKNILIIGQGRLVGSPLKKLLDESSINSIVADENTKNLPDLCITADVIISATGQPGLLRPEMIKKDAVVIDAGTSSEAGKISGDVAPDVYNRDDLTITPTRGGVGPLTICALYENVIIAAQQLE